MRFEPTPATPADLPALIKLIGTSDGCSPQTVWSLPWDLPFYWVVRDHEQIVASGSLQPVDGVARAEIRGLVVAPSYQGQGLAGKFVTFLQDRAAKRGIDVVCVSTSPGFFEKQGFSTTPAHWLPAHRVHAVRGARPRVGLRLSAVRAE
jgi:N-acetylglutamate synthase-like GNAT family acetyltransferase